MDRDIRKIWDCQRLSADIPSVVWTILHRRDKFSSSITGSVARILYAGYRSTGDAFVASSRVQMLLYYPKIKENKWSNILMIYRVKALKYLSLGWTWVLEACRG